MRVYDWSSGLCSSQLARGVGKGDADFLMLCTTTFHRVAEQVEAAVDIPLLHLADVIAGKATANRVEKLALIGTKFAMSRTFFTDRIASHGIEVIVPDAEKQDRKIGRASWRARGWK